jgi:hypothetical protein
MTPNLVESISKDIASSRTLTTPWHNRNCAGHSVCLACVWIAHDLGEGRKDRHDVRDAAMQEMLKNSTDPALQYPGLETPGKIGPDHVRLLCGAGGENTPKSGTLERYCSKAPGCAGRKNQHLGETDILYIAKALKVNIKVLHVWHQGTDDDQVGEKDYEGGEGCTTNIILARTGGYRGAAVAHYEPVLNSTEFWGSGSVDFAGALLLAYQGVNAMSGTKPNPAKRSRKMAEKN